MLGCALTLLAVTLLAGGPTAAQAEALRVYVLVTDGLNPAEVTDVNMPNLARLKAEGTWYEQARSVFVAETIPNHVAMMTGVLPQRSGIVGNSSFDPRAPQAGDVEMSDPALLSADTLLTRLERDCTTQDVSTATVLSKAYLWGIFREGGTQRSADYHWDPRPTNIPGSGHSPDAFTFDELNGWVFTEKPATPQFAFVNLGDIDRTGHVDESGGISGGQLSELRRTAMRDTDTLLGDFVDSLRAAGVWESTVLIVTSDHGMDYSTPDSYVDLEAAFTDAGLTVGLDPATDDVGFSENGGGALVYVHDPANRPAVAEALDGLTGVERVLASSSTPGLEAYGLAHPRAGDFVALAEDGYRFASGDFGNSNPLPGNHGHTATQHSVALVSGGHPALAPAGNVAGPAVYAPDQPIAPPQDGPGNLSVAPTVAAMFGLPAPAGGFDGPMFSEAFDSGALDAALTGACANATGPPACPPGEVPPSGFTDVAGNTHQLSIDCVAWYGITQGTSDGRYSPSDRVPRDQMASFLARLIETAGAELPAPSGRRFSDVADDNVHRERIEQLAEAGVVEGTSATTYEPRATVSRGQMASFLVRSYEYVAQATLPDGSNAFADDDGSTHSDAIDRAAAAGFTSGYVDGKYRPAAATSRDQMATYLSRVLDRFSREGRVSRP